MNRTVQAWLASVLIAGVACSSSPSETAKPQARDAGPAARSEPAPRNAEPEPPPPPPAPPKRLFAARYVSRIRKGPSKESPMVGYMRGGAVLMAKTAEPLGHDKCRKGWFELESGGFICSTLDAIPFMGKRLPERRALQPDLTAPLPYPYGYSRAKNTPVYRRLPSDEEAAEFEGYRIPGRSPPDAGAAGGGDAAQAAGDTVTAPQAAGEPGEGDEVDEGVPTLSSLMGDTDSVLVRRMERGFYVSLDREMTKGARKYWRTQANGFIPHKRLFLVKPGEFSGVELGAGGHALPLGFVLSSKAFAYTRNERGGLRRAGKPGYHFMFAVTGEEEIRGTAYLTSSEGRLFRAKDVARIAPRDKPAEVAADEKWIDIDLASQSLVAYVGETPVYATLISSGRVKDELDPLRNFKTPEGAFRIRAKHLTTTMEGDHAIDGPYSIEDVPYVMFFYQGGFALHSAFWHNSFGRPRSHGCVNLAPLDARWLFNWTEPALPGQWHGVYASDDALGTRIYVHGETPEG